VVLITAQDASARPRRIKAFDRETVLECRDPITFT
jgi:hypothetical protein